MSKVLWHITMSLDGFVAGPDDDMGWLFGCGFAPDPQFVLQTLNQIGALLIGHRTYHGGDGDQGAKTEQGEPYGGAWHGPQFVFTRDDPGTAAPGFTFVGPDIKQAVQLAKDAAGGKYVSVLGPGLAAKVLGAGLLDEILVHVAPVLLGDGRRLYDHPGMASIPLQPIGPTPQMTNIWMRVQPGILPGE
jgi:dihydrofolate reductase